MKKTYYIFFFTVVLILPSLVMARFATFDTRALLLTVLASLVAGSIIEIAAVRHGKKDKKFVYEYNQKFVLGPKLFGTPIEDSVVFLIFTPIFIVFFYELLVKLL